LASNAPGGSIRNLRSSSVANRTTKFSKIPDFLRHRKSFTGGVQRSQYEVAWKDILARYIAVCTSQDPLLVDGLNSPHCLRYLSHFSETKGFHEVA
jgi:hypothetical protein